jgi:hypothetical protein
MEVPVSLDAPVTIQETKPKQTSTVKMHMLSVNLAQKEMSVYLTGRPDPVQHTLTEQEYTDFLTLLGPFLRGVVKAGLATNP